MPITSWIPAVSKVVNNTDVSAEVVNPILEQLVQREQHLYEKFNEFSGRSVLIAFDQEILDSAIRVGNAVFFDKDTNTGISLARTELISTSSHQSSFSLANSSYTAGLVKSINESANTAEVYIYGIADLANRLDHPTLGLLQTSETNVSDSATFSPGPLFLSRTEAGKLTSNPGGIAVYVGFAIDKLTFLVSPNVSEFSNLFTQFHYNILDRPAGIPSLSGGIWSLTAVDTGIVGWIPVANVPVGYTVPVGAKFFFNLPAASVIDAETSLLLEEREEAKSLALALPPFPPNLTFLTNNGVVQINKDFSDGDGIYKCDQYGIWWFSELDGYQPWAADMPAAIAITADGSTDTFTLAAHGFATGDRVRFSATGSLPTGISALTNYYLFNVTTNTFQVTSTVGGLSATAFTGNGVGVQIPQPYAWKYSTGKGTDPFRARLFIQFSKFNPDLRNLLVTSISPFYTGSGILKYYSKVTPTKEASVGDLLAKVDIQFLESDITSSATAISDLTYEPTTGKITKNVIPVVSSLQAGEGIDIESTSTPGRYTVSVGGGGRQGKMDSIEPDNVRLELVGLHSYLRFEDPSVLPGAITGKFRIIPQISGDNITFVLYLFGTTGLSIGSTSNTVSFDLSYSISKDGAVISSNVVTSTASVSFPVPYVANTCVKFVDIGVIPASVLDTDCIVNFKLVRKTSTYMSPVGLIDLYWKLG